MTYLDHINGRKHQRKLGFSMRVERSTKDQMLGRLSQLAKEKERTEQKKAENKLLALAGFEEKTKKFEQVVKAKDKEEEQRRAEKAKRRQEKKKEKQSRNHGPEPPPPKQEGNEEEGGEEEEEEEVEEEGINPDMAAMMGFSGFK